ncbi:MAG: HupE/UreJ family protein [Spirochaetota bacterium]
MEASFFSLLSFGFLFGMKHAVEADHLMAMVSFTAQAKSWRQSFQHGVTWGIGHTTTLFIFSLFVFLVDSVIPEKIASALEFVVGVMLVILGSHLLLTIGKKAKHPPTDSHDESKRLWRTLSVGLIHGMAGSAALILLTLSTVNSLGVGLLYVFCFGLGSIAGMGILSAILVLPFLYTEKYLQRFHWALQWCTSLGTVIFGIYIMIQPFL